MKKTITLILLALFLFSIVPVYAHEGEDILEESKSLVKPSLIAKEKKDMHGVNSDKQCTTEQDCMDLALCNGIECTCYKGKCYTGYLAEPNNDKKDILKGRLMALEGDLTKAKNVFHTTKGVFSKIKGFCKKNPKDIRCNGEFTDTSKKYLENLADTILKVLEKRKAKLEDLRLEIGESNLENKEDLLKNIDERLKNLDEKISNIKDLKDKIGDTKTREELKELARLMKDEWKDAKQFLKVSGGATVADRFTGLLHKTDKLKEKLDGTLKRLTEKGFDISGIQDKVDSFNGHLDEARKLVDDARAKFAEAKLSPDNDRALVKEGTGFLREAQEHLKLAHKELKEIVRLIKSTGENLEDVPYDNTVPAIY